MNQVEKRFEKRINDMFYKMGGMDNNFINIELSDIVTKNILKHQILHVMNLVNRFQTKKNKINNLVSLDGSAPGTGKTYTSMAICSQLNLEPIIICPKSSITNWKNIAKIFNVRPLTIVNYETIRNCKIYDGNMNIIQTDIISKKDNAYVWNVDSTKNIFIFDEVHRCKHVNTYNGKLLISTKNIARILMLSGTVSDKCSDFLIFGYMLDFYNSMKKGKTWINWIIRQEKHQFGNNNILYNYLYPSKGSRMEFSDMENDLTPSHNISVDCYSLDSHSLKIMNSEFSKIKNSLENKIEITKILKSRQIIEKLKIPIMIDLCEKYLELNCSIVFFVNFVETLETIRKYFHRQSIPISYISGQQTIAERDYMINNFQNNNVKIIVSMIQAGGESISLHDLDGNHPRVSIISPSFSGIELMQALGRIYRTGTKSKVIQKIIFCENTCEEIVYLNLKDKINFINNLSDDNRNKIDSFMTPF